MKSLIIGVWFKEKVVQSRPTNLTPQAELIAKEITKHASLLKADRSDFQQPDLILYIDGLREGPKITYSWMLGGEYGKSRDTRAEVL